MKCAKNFLGRFDAKAVGLTLLACSWAIVASAAALDHQVELDIGAQPLSSALIEYSRQANVQVVTRAADISGTQTAGVVGRMSADEGLQRLLAGTRFSYVTVGDGTVEISATQDAAAPDASPTASIAGPGVVTLAQAVDAVAGDGAAQPVPGGAGSGATAQSTISGHVIDAIAASNLPGALVRILETGQQTQTDDLGFFRLRDVPSGEYTLSISYIGFADRLWRVQAGPDERSAAEYPLDRAEWDMAQVTVFGTRSARALALNQQRAADNSSSILSADMLGNFTGTTISEALRRVEGIAMVRDATTGDGTNVVIRGFEPNMNNIKLNGLNLPGGFRVAADSANMSTRSADLSFMLAESVAKITVNKTLLPSHDSAGTGGLVEIETKSPLDRPHRFGSFSIEGARKGNDFGDDFLASGTVSGTFGAERSVGLSASAQYRKRSTRNFQYGTQSVYGPFQPLAEDGTPLEDIYQADPRRLFPFDPQGDRVFPITSDNSLLDVDSQNLTVTLSGAWQPAEHSSLKLDLSRASDLSDTFQRRAAFRTQMAPIFVPINALGGESRTLYAWNGDTSAEHQYRLWQDVKSVSDVASFNGKTDIGRVSLNYTLGYARGSTENPAETTFSMFRRRDGIPLDPDQVLPAAVDPVEGRIISLFGERSGRGYPLPLLSQSGFAYFNDADNYTFFPFSFVGQYRSTASENTRRTADLSAHYEIGHRFFRNIEVGANFEKSEFRGTRSDAVTLTASCPPPDYTCASASDMGIRFDEPGLAAIGRSEAGFNVISRQSFTGFAARLRGMDAEENPPLLQFPETLHPQFFDQTLREDNLAAYAQARVDIGKLEIIGGARLSRVDVLSRQLSFPIFFDENGATDPQFEAQFTRLLDLDAVTTDILPRVLFNYRQSRDLIFRGGYFLSVARPGLFDLAQIQQVALYLYDAVFDPITSEGHPLLTINQGNPGLDPTVTHSFDLSAEYYVDQIGLMRISGFYKRSHGLLETNQVRLTGELDDIVVLPDHPHFRDLPDDLVVESRHAVNSSDPAHLWGIEAGIERQLAFLPGIWSGLGIYTNLTYTTSSKTEIYNWPTPTGEIPVRIENQPYGKQSAYTGTASLTYNKYGIDATLAYSMQTRALQAYAPYGLSPYSEKYDSLDLHVAKELATGLGKFTVFFEGADLLKGPSSPDLESSLGGHDGVPKVYTGGGFIGGRQFRLGLRASF